MRFATVAPMAALFFLAFGSPVFGQSLFETLPAAEAEQAQAEQEEELRGPLTAEQKAAGMRESIF
jgi:hypothetical protein